jgi:hypothetical protein
MITYFDLRDWLKEFGISQSYFRAYRRLIATGKASRRLDRLIQRDRRHRDLLAVIVDTLIGGNRNLLLTAQRHGIPL